MYKQSFPREAARSNRHPSGSQREPAPSSIVDSVTQRNSQFPAWLDSRAPWLRQLVFEPDCSEGTHPTLRHLAKWLFYYMPPDECPGLALRWLREAGDRCDRVPDDDELERLLEWAGVGDNLNPQ